MNPTFEQATAHRGDAFIQHSRQRVFRPPCQILSELQIATGCRVQLNVFAVLNQMNALNMRQGGALRFTCVLQ